MQALLQEILARSGTAQLPADQPNHKRLACHVTLLKQLLQVGVFGPLQVSNSSNVLLVSNVYPVAFLWTNISKLSHVVLIDLRALAPKPSHCAHQLAPTTTTQLHSALPRQSKCNATRALHVQASHSCTAARQVVSRHNFWRLLAQLLSLYLAAPHACLKALTDTPGVRDMSSWVECVKMSC